MSLEVSKEERKQKALENLKRGRELRAKKLAEKKEPEPVAVVDEMSELDETPKPKPAKKPRVKKVSVVEPIVETPKPEPPVPSPPPPPPPIETPIAKPKKQYKPREPKPPVVVEKVVERVIYAPPPLEIQFF
jgi:protein TonB